MKNISDLVLLIVIAFVFLKKKKKHKTCSTSGFGVFSKQGLQCSALATAAGEGAERVGAQPWVGLGQVGVWKEPNMSQHSRAEGRSNGLQPSSFGVSMFQR